MQKLEKSEGANIVDTQQKYNEAKYFLGMMKENIEDRQKFKYDLSAFVSAARSVTLVLQTEVKSKNRDFDEWYSKKQMLMGKDEMFKFFNEQRIIVIHTRGSIDPQAEISENIDFGGAASFSIKSELRDAEGNLKDYEYFEQLAKPKPASNPNSREETNYKWFFKDWQETDEDAITFCERYLKELKIIVEEAESKFGEADAPQKQLTDK